jgi:predicted regulator of Ras-like GTPase activity (Roadblock/LC7/MglB family)
MEAILQSLMDLGGVTAAMVFDSSGQLLGNRGHAVYDPSLCAHVSGVLAKALDAVQLQQEDWETVTAQYADGKIVLRRVIASGQTHVLAVVADGSLNASFATVALRVAAGKLKRLLEGGASTSGVGLGGSGAGAARPGPGVSGVHPGGSGVHPGDSRPNLANSGLSWSKISSVGLSRVAVADPASGAFLARCAKELAQYVGPIAKVYVEEGVRRVTPDAPFAMAQARSLVEDLAAQIEDTDDRASFQKALSK